MATFYPCTKEDEIYEWELVRFLNDLAFMKDKSEYDLELARRQLEVYGKKQ
jgi:hypothetical protein